VEKSDNDQLTNAPMHRNDSQSRDMHRCLSLFVALLTSVGDENDRRSDPNVNAGGSRIKMQDDRWRHMNVLVLSPDHQGAHSPSKNGTWTPVRPPMRSWVSIKPHVASSTSQRASAKPSHVARVFLSCWRGLFVIHLASVAQRHVWKQRRIGMALIFLFSFFVGTDERLIELPSVGAARFFTLQSEVFTGDVCEVLVFLRDGRKVAL